MDVNCLNLTGRCNTRSLTQRYLFFEDLHLGLPTESFLGRCSECVGHRFKVKLSPRPSSDPFAIPEFVQHPKMSFLSGHGTVVEGLPCGLVI